MNVAICAGDETDDPYPDEIIAIFLFLLSRKLPSHIINGVFPEPPTVKFPTTIVLCFGVYLLKIL